MMDHDVIAIGGSAGALEVLLRVAQELPAALAASIFIAVHVHPDQPSMLPDLMSRRGPLPASHPLHREPIERGHIYIAPPDNHLLVREGFMEVVRGPMENGHRPATDALFRSASAAYGTRVIGVIVSGYLDCGTAGMMSVKARGGVSVVQDPDSALAPDMPLSVLRKVTVDHVARPEQLARLLVDLVATPAGPAREPDQFVRRIEGIEPGLPASIVCPLCLGVLTEAQSHDFEHFRCHVGHAFTLESLVRQQSEATERALWAAVRVLEESAALSDRMSRREANTELRSRFEEKTRTQRQQAEHIRRILLWGDRLIAPDAPTAS